jgi:hypothetical protein
MHGDDVAERAVAAHRSDLADPVCGQSRTAVTEPIMEWALSPLHVEAEIVRLRDVAERLVS